MSWTLQIWFAYSDRADPTIVEEFDTAGEGQTRADEVLADGYSVSDPGVEHHFFPAAAVTHVKLFVTPEPPEE